MVWLVDNLIGLVYFGSASAIVYNLIRAKLYDDYHEEIKTLREYDLKEDVLKPEKFDVPDGGKYLVAC